MNLYDLHNDPKSLHKHEEAHNTVTDLIFGELRKGKRINDKQVTALASNKWAAVKYAVDYLHGRFKEAEPVIAKDAYQSMVYARRALKGRFPAGENIIAQDPNSAGTYAMEIIKGKWPEGEKAIASQALRARNYAVFVLKDKFPEGEKAISQSVNFTKFYNEMLKKKGYSDDDLIDVKKDINKIFHP